MKNVVLCDMSSIVKGLAFAKDNSDIASQVDNLRGMLLNHLQRVNTKMKGTGRGKPELVLVYDMPQTWRKTLFNLYKWKDPDAVNSNPIDMANFYNNFNKIKDEFIESLPLTSCSVMNAEADDVIAVVTKIEVANGNNVSIISNDEDFLQLRSDKVHQYKATKLTKIEAEYDLFEHVCRGDRADGIPNIISPVDSFATKTRMRTLRSSSIEEWREHADSPEMFCDNASMFDRFILNRKLIDFNYIDTDIVDAVYKGYEASKGVSPTMKLSEYCNRNKLSNFMFNGGFQ